MNDPGSDLLHGDPFELVRSLGGCALETRDRAAPQLLRALRGYVDEEKPAGDRRSRFLRNIRAGLILNLWSLHHGDSTE